MSLLRGTVSARTVCSDCGRLDAHGDCLSRGLASGTRPGQVVETLPAVLGPCSVKLS